MAPSGNTAPSHHPSRRGHRCRASIRRAVGAPARARRARRPRAAAPRARVRVRRADLCRKASRHRRARAGARLRPGRQSRRAPARRRDPRGRSPLRGAGISSGRPRAARLTVRRGGCGARRGRVEAEPAAGHHPRPRRGRRERQDLADREPAQDAARDGRGHPRRADQARRADAGAALSRASARRDRARRSRARCSTSTRRSPTGSASGSSSGSSRTCRCARSSPTLYKQIAARARRAAARPRSATSRTSIAMLERELAAAGIERRGQRTAEAHLQHLQQDAPQGCRASTRSTTSARCASSSTTSRTATPRSASSTTSGRRCPSEFDDYIAKPEGATDYRSLHTAVIGPEGKPLEVQIRTREMHQHSEYGVAAHWRYKEGGGSTRAIRRSTTRSRGCARCSTGRTRSPTPREWLRRSRSASFTDTIYVLTPQGKVIDLPRGATPVDFAYAVHTDLGHRCRGAKVDGADGAAQLPLDNGQRVEIVAAKQGGPSRDWLNPSSATSRAIARAPRSGSGSRRSSTTRRVAQGRAIVERELARVGATALKLEALAAQAGFAKADELFAAVARDEINLRAGADRDQRGAAPRSSRRRRRSRKRRRARKSRAVGTARAASWSSASTG